jgi:3-methyladenine DNA glycosylase AlkC
VEPLKNFFDRRVIGAISAEFASVWPSFAQRAFVSACLRDLEALTLTQRAGHIADVLHRHLSVDYPRAVELMIGTLASPHPGVPASAMASFRYLPHVTYVARYGLEHFEASMRAQLELTQRFTAEFSIRAFIVRHPEQTYAQLLAWTEHPNVHVRRLVSEGTRTRLPWAPRLAAYQREPAPVMSLLERLKDDPERYVQRSVANSLNDLAKDHPERVIELCRRWLVGASEARTWIVRHGLRSLVKRGHRGALGLLGASEGAEVEVTRVAFTPRKVRLGDELRFTVELASVGRRVQELVVDYAVHFVKANGERKPKVFKLKRLTLAPGASAALAGRVSFAEKTTRKHYCGRHAIDLLVNGETFALGEFNVS